MYLNTAFILSFDLQCQGQRIKPRVNTETAVLETFQNAVSIPKSLYDS